MSQIPYILAAIDVMTLKMFMTEERQLVENLYGLSIIVLAKSYRILKLYEYIICIS